MKPTCFQVKVKKKMVLVAEIETVKKYMVDLEIDIKAYTRDISLPIKERMFAQWEYLKQFIVKLEEESKPPVVSPAALKTKK